MDVLVECKGLKKSYGKIPVIKNLICHSKEEE